MLVLIALDAKTFPSKFEIEIHSDMQVLSLSARFHLLPCIGRSNVLVYWMISSQMRLRTKIMMILDKHVN